jgi:prepilin-type N-terminal cleavage/methylation domain-containing protein
MRNQISDSHLAANDGFSLIELMVSAVLIAMILGGVLPLLTGGQNAYEAQSADMSMRQGARVALDKVTRETRLAGYGIDNIAQVFTVASSTSIQFAADVDDGDAGAPCDASFENAANGGAERLTYAVSGTNLTRSVDCWNGTTWTSEISAQVLIADLETGLTIFRFFDENGTEMTGTLSSANRDAIRSVAIQLDLEDTSYDHLGDQEHSTYQIASQVEVHNLQ